MYASDIRDATKQNESKHLSTAYCVNLGLKVRRGAIFFFSASSTSTRRRVVRYALNNSRQLISSGHCVTPFADQTARTMTGSTFFRRYVCLSCSIEEQITLFHSINECNDISVFKRCSQKSRSAMSNVLPSFFSYYRKVEANSSHYESNVRTASESNSVSVERQQHFATMRSNR